MQKFIVPQFIDIESKIFGPITVRQFLILLAGLMAGFISYKLSDFTLFILEAVVILILAVALAFVKVNGAPFHIFLLNYIKTMKSAKVRVWKRQSFIQQTKKKEKENISDKPISARARVSMSRLSELSLIIDTGGAYQGEDPMNVISDTAPVGIDNKVQDNN